MLSEEEAEELEEEFAKAEQEMAEIMSENLEDNGKEESVTKVNYEAMQKIYNLFLYLVIEKYGLSLMETVWVIFSLKTRFITQLSVMQSEANANRDEETPELEPERERNNATKRSYV